MPFHRFEDIESHYLTPHLSTGKAPVIDGQYMYFCLLHKNAGTGSELHYHPNELLIFPLRGKIKAIVGRDRRIVSPAAVALTSSDELMATEFAARARAAWARLIRKVYEADPLECPKCKGPMRVIALIEDPGVIRRILEHLGLWAPLATERSPPPGPANWPRYASLPLTYHPVPDIA